MENFTKEIQSQTTTYSFSFMYKGNEVCGTAILSGDDFDFGVEIELDSYWSPKNLNENELDEIYEFVENNILNNTPTNQ
jgi:hypothetical protein